MHVEKSKEFFEFKKKLDFLKAQRGEGTELISVYIKPDGNVADTVNRLRDEYSQSMNIKSKRTRKNVQDAIDRILQMLKGVHKSPETGVAVFSGSIKEKIEIYTVIPPSPVNVQIYRCDSTFFLDPLYELIAPQEIYGLVVLDRREATIAILKGKHTDIMIHMTSNVPGKHHKGGQCLAPDSLVMLADGRIKEINELKEKDCVKSADFAGNRFLDSTVADKWETNKEDIYTIKTKYPSSEIICSGDHGIFVRNGRGIEEMPAKELTKEHTLLMPEVIEIAGEEQKLSANHYFRFKITKEGTELIKKKRLESWRYQREIGQNQTIVSHIELGKHMPTFENLEKVCKRLDIDFSGFKEKYLKPDEEVNLPEKLTPAVAQFAGYFIGDGNFDKNRLCFSEQDEQVANAYKELIESIFTKQTGLKYRADKNYWELRVYSKTLTEWLHDEIVTDKKEIPEKILLSKDDVVAAFLRGLFDAEGYVSHGHLALGINNKKLAQQTRLALLRFGIIASMNVYDNRRNPYSKKPRYTLQVAELESLQRFSENISFVGKKKNELLNFTIKKKAKISRTRRILVTGKQIRTIIEKHGWNLQRFPRAGGSSFFHNKKEMSKVAFARSILEPARTNPALYAELEGILNCPIIPVKVSKIEQVKRNTNLVDICVDKQNFVANGLLVHNSALRFERLIEQSAEDFFHKICEHLNQLMKDVKVRGVIVGGPGMTKNEVINSDRLYPDVKNKIIGVFDTSYTDEYGIKELTDRAAEVMKKLDVQKEKDIINKFIKDAVTGGPATYGLDEVKEALAIGKVEILLLSEKLDESTINELTKLADGIDAKVEMISIDTPEGEQFYSGFRGIGAILRYK